MAPSSTVVAAGLAVALAGVVAAFSSTVAPAGPDHTPDLALASMPELPASPRPPTLERLAQTHPGQAVEAGLVLARPHGREQVLQLAAELGVEVVGLGTTFQPAQGPTQSGTYWFDDADDLDSAFTRYEDLLAEQLQQAIGEARGEAARLGDEGTGHRHLQQAWEGRLARLEAHGLEIHVLYVLGTPPRLLQVSDQHPAVVSASPATPVRPYVPVW